MDYSTIFMIIFSLHSGSCYASSQGYGYTPPTGYLVPSDDVCPCGGQKKNVIFSMTTIRITETVLPPPIMETKRPPAVTSFITVPDVSVTVTVITTIPQVVVTKDVTLEPVTISTSPPMITILSPYSVTSTEIKEPITKTITQEVTKLVTAKPFLTTLYLKSTKPQDPSMHVTSYPPVTNTVTVPESISFITNRITVTEALPAIIKTVRTGSTKTVRPRPVTVTPPPVTIHSPAHIVFETIGMTVTSVAPPVTKFRTHTITEINTDCTDPGYVITTPAKGRGALEFKTPDVAFNFG